jgi:hypothetical protein
VILQQWPDWHYGVLSMYSNHLAINHLVVDEQFDIQIGDDLLDQSCKSVQENDIDEHKWLHLHSWHGHQPFSKFDFKKNQYDHIDPKMLMNLSNAQAYVINIDENNDYRLKISNDFLSRLCASHWNRNA